jgi:hypothetical protein
MADTLFLNTAAKNAVGEMRQSAPVALKPSGTY